MFGTAAAAQRPHGIFPSISANSNDRDTPGLLELLGGQFDALAAASSTSNAAMDHLAAATTLQYADTKAALTNLSAATAATPTPIITASTRTGSLPSDQGETKKRIIILQAAVKNKWKVGGFCLTHGHGVHASHISTNYNDKIIGHVNAVTRSSPAGSGKDINKGWDDWIM